MKLKSLLAIAVIFMLVSFKGENTEIKGTWKAISIETNRNGMKVIRNYENDNEGQLKTWSDNYFLFVGSGTFGGGTYELSGTHYSEKFQYHVAQGYPGSEIKMLLEMKGDTLIQTYPVDDNFIPNKNNCNIEKYVRVD
ncbi:MAG: hypothetical protein JXR68_08440 [Bacteroidales bacterium]|nr:hypothetical protein [Bacteroidales bacterium]